MTEMIELAQKFAPTATVNILHVIKKVEEGINMTRSVMKDIKRPKKGPIDEIHNM